jgi:hypothetical protein
MSKRPHPPTGASSNHLQRLRLLWGPHDSEATLAHFKRLVSEAAVLGRNDPVTQAWTGQVPMGDDWDQHTQDALEASKQVHPATLSKQLGSDYIHQEWLEPEPENHAAQPCPVFDIFTKRRVL